MFGYDPRSSRGDEYDDYSDSQPGWDWEFILWLPVILLFMFLIPFVPLFMLAGYFLSDVYSTLKKTIGSGELAYPFHAKVGIVVAIILARIVLGHSSSSPLNPTSYSPCQLVLCCFLRLSPL